MTTQAPATSASSVLRTLRTAVPNLGRMGALAALIVIVLADMAFVPNFASADNFWNILIQVTPIVIVGLGMTLVMATRGVDLSVGSVMAISATTVAALYAEHGVFFAMAAGLAVATAVGVFNGALVAGARIQPIVVTLATLITVRGLAQVIGESGGQVIDDSSFFVLGRGYVGPIPVQVLAMLVMIGLVGFIMRASTFGRAVAATGGNEAAAELAGISTLRTKLIVYSISGVLAGFAGLIVAARLGAADGAKIGLTMELDAIAAVVVGGRALSGGQTTVTGTVIGALLMGVITASLNMLLVPFAWSLIIKAAIIVGAVMLQRSDRA